MRRLAGGVLLVALLLSRYTRADEIYRWTDPARRVHYSNTPTTGPEATAVGSEGFSVLRSTPAAAITPPPEGLPLSAEISGGSGGAVATGDDATFSTAVSMRRNALERDLRATERRLKEIDGQLAALARARTRNAAGNASTGGVAASAAHVRSPEEEALADERERLAQHGIEVRGEAVKLRDEVTARLGTTPSWWIDLR